MSKLEQSFAADETFQMKLSRPSNPSPEQRLRGFTIIELTVTLVIGLMIATTSMALFNNQLTYFRLVQTQDFMIEEAPQINNTLNSIVSRADAMLVEEDKITLSFNNPGDNTTITAEIIYENDILKYQTADSEWDISTQLKDVDFSVNSGVLTIKLTGPNDGEINFSTTPLK